MNVDNNNTSNPQYKEELYLCQKCGTKFMFSSISNIVCKNCGWRIFRKPQCDTIIRVKAV